MQVVGQTADAPTCGHAPAPLRTFSWLMVWSAISSPALYTFITSEQAAAQRGEENFQFIPFANSTAPRGGRIAAWQWAGLMGQAPPVSSCAVTRPACIIAALCPPSAAPSLSTHMSSRPGPSA